MPLTLNVTSSNNHAIEEQIAYDFSENGGTIGRRLSNTWVLPDENRHLSGSHARIEFEKGDYYIIDTSTNGVFVNGNAKPLGSETRHVLEDGFQLIMGTYTIAVSVSNDLVATNDNSDSQDLNQDNLFADLVDESNDNSDSIPLQDFPVKENTSPLSVDTGSEDPFFEFNEFSSDDDVINKVPNEPPKRVENDQIPELDSFFQPAKVKHLSVSSSGSFQDKEKEKESVASEIFKEDTDISLIPDDWDFSGGNDPFDDMLTGIGNSRKENIAPKKEEIRPAEDVVSSDDDSFDDLLVGTGDPFVTTEARPPPRKKNTPPKREVDPFEEKKTTSKEEIAAFRKNEKINSLKIKTESPESKSSTSLSPLFEGMGIDEKLLGSSFSEEHLFLAGKLFRLAIQGTMEVLQSRAEIKNEMRMDMTTIQPIQNNPIKFAAGADEALRKLFTLQNKSYMDPEEAMMEAYDDIKSHQVAVISGIQASLVYVLKRFEPKNLIQRLEKESPISANIPIHRKAKLWDKFEELYDTIESEAEDDFNRLFGQEFAKAYDKQVTLLKKERE